HRSTSLVFNIYAPPCFLLLPTHSSLAFSLSLHDALPISDVLHSILEAAVADTVGQAHAPFVVADEPGEARQPLAEPPVARLLPLDRKSTRLNSSHVAISYAVFCLKKKNMKDEITSILKQS